MRTRAMPTLSYRTSDGACHRVLVATVGDCPLVIDVADRDARLVDRLDAPGEGPEAAGPAAAAGIRPSSRRPAAAHSPAAVYRRQCSVAGRPLHGPAAPRVALAQVRHGRALAA